MPPPADTAPLLDLDGARATVRLNRPSQHNRIDPEDIPVLHAHLDAIEAAPGVRVVVLAASGPRSFSSGYTLQSIAERLEERALERLLDRIEHLRLPSIAAIHGGVFGGATDLALCCDLRIGVQACRMFMPAARFALHYYPGGLRRYVERLGYSAANKLFLTAEPIDADEMLRIGFLTDLVGAEELGDTVARYVQAFADNDAAAVAAMKASLREIAGGRADASVLERRYLDSLGSANLRDRLATRLRG